ncbi:protein SIEVE ELEMENT OCCLUSION B-like protein [Cinnamomum micranthum f. kanehirae]|uniref:Protein SIEVE ELEMENT OCCLUSION B-like protein n=1 Tax=Cinnamomum micranthum f. kanehirae TaxID=337451 RepID=A0A3S3MT84_9MAGN|nr:protein SIEVE ELEMENT OCCLUSION B-like protein [Cinnamomum micranthum f. kanehirae]
MKCHSLHYSVILQSYVIQYIKKEWHLEEKEAMEGEKLICLCGGDDLGWIANFISKAKKVIKGDGIILELIHVGAKRVENIEGNQIKYWADLQEIRQFRARLNSIMHSIMQPHLSINKNIMNDVMTLLGAQGSGQGWTVLGQFGSGYVTAVNGNIMMESLDRIQTQTDITVENFFPTLVNVIQVVTPVVPKHCYHIITYSTSGIKGKDMYCVCCRGRMQKYTMYKCCVE